MDAQKLVEFCGILLLIPGIEGLVIGTHVGALGNELVVFGRFPLHKSRPGVLKLLEFPVCCMN